MLPTFKPGDLLLGSSLIKPKAGHVVVVKKRLLSIKRVKRITEDGYWLEGDNQAASTDSREYGYVPQKDLQAVIFMKL